MTEFDLPIKGFINNTASNWKYIVAFILYLHHAVKSSRKDSSYGIVVSGKLHEIGHGRECRCTNGCQLIVIQVQHLRNQNAQSVSHKQPCGVLGKFYRQIPFGTYNTDAIMRKTR